MTSSFDVESAGRSILETAGFGWDEAPGALAIAHGLGLRVVRLDWLRGEDATSILPDATGIPTTIGLRHGLDPIRTAWCIVHEVAEIDMITVGYKGEDVEACAEALAAALLMGRVIFQQAVGELGANLTELARAFAVPETAVALRLAEVGSVDAAAVVTPQRVHVRLATEEFLMPGEHELRSLSRRGHPGLRKVALRDQPKRVALFAEG